MREGAVSAEEALERLRALPYEDLGFASVDHHRALRKGFPEVVLGEGKTPEQSGGDRGAAGGTGRPAAGDARGRGDVPGREGARAGRGVQRDGARDHP